MGGIGYRSGCGKEASIKAGQTSFSHHYGNQEKVRRRILVRLTVDSGNQSDEVRSTPYL